MKELLKQFILEVMKQKLVGSKWTVEKAGNIPEKSNLFGLKTYNITRRELNVPLLIANKVVYITHAHDSPLKNNPEFQSQDGLKQISAQNKEGWIILPEEEWLFSVVSYWNLLQGGWAKAAPKYLKPSSYGEARDYINDKTRIYDGKYLQILWSAAKLGLTSEDVFS